MVEDKNSGEEPDEGSSLDDEIRRLKKMIEDTLMEVRVLISELENPFQYLSKYISGKDLEGGGDRREIKVDRSGFKKEDREKVIVSKEDKDSMKKVGDIKVDSRHELNILYEKALLLADILLRLFGRDNTHKMLHLFYRRGIIDEETYMTMLDVIDYLNIESEYGFIESKASIEDYLFALYLLNKLKDKYNDELFYALLIAVRKSLESKIGFTNIPPFFNQFPFKGRSNKEEDNNA